MGSPEISMTYEDRSTIMALCARHGALIEECLTHLAGENFELPQPAVSVRLPS
jgi:hypothetical protein